MLDHTEYCVLQITQREIRATSATQMTACSIFCEFGKSGFPLPSNRHSGFNHRKIFSSFQGACVEISGQVPFSPQITHRTDFLPHCNKYSIGNSKLTVEALFNFFYWVLGSPLFLSKNPVVTDGDYSRQMQPHRKV